MVHRFPLAAAASAATPFDDYISIREAVARAGMSEPAFRRRVRAGAIKLYSNPPDLRQKLVRRDELDVYLRSRQPLVVGDEEGRRDK